MCEHPEQLTKKPTGCLVLWADQARPTRLSTVQVAIIEADNSFSSPSSPELIIVFASKYTHIDLGDSAVGL